MRKTIAIIGTLLIAAVLIISGSAVASWLYVGDVEDYEDCTNPYEAIGAPDGDHATIGINFPPTEGWINLSLAALSGLPQYTEFIVFASSTVRENYSLQVVSLLFQKSSWSFGNDDTQNQDFTTETLNNPQNDVWMYFMIYCEGGSINDTDQIYGSEIDAIGWNR
jgi:hypothetical protein